jgi:hypothetical protein
MKAAVLSVFAPAGAIAAGALLQLGLLSLWPGVQNHTISNVSVDSYCVVVALGVLCFWTGTMLWKRAPARSTILLSLLVPVAWLLSMLFAKYTPPTWSSSLGAVYLLGAVAPLLGFALAYARPSNNRWRGP